MRVKTISIGLCVCVLAAAGCETERFEVLAPGFRSQAGNALVSVSVPSFSRGLIKRLRLRVSSADTARIRPIERDMNFPVPGGNLAVGQVTDIPSGVRRFTVTAFDTEDVIRFRGESDSPIFIDQTQLVEVTLERVGGTVHFRSVLSLSSVDTSQVDSTILAALPLTSVLDILELVAQPAHPRLAMLPLLSVALGDGFTSISQGVFSRRITVAQIPIGSRRFVAHLKDLSSSSSRAFADTITVVVDTLGPQEAVFNLTQVRGADALREVFFKTTLPRDSTVVVITPQF